MKHSLAFVLLLFTAACDVVSEPPDLQVMHESRPLAEAKELDVDLKYDVGQLEITRAQGSDLFSFDLQYDRRRYDPKFSFADNNGRASFGLDMNSRGAVAPSRGKDNDLTVRLSDQVVINLDLRAGVAESHLEMSGLKVRRMQLHGGVGKTEVTFDKPSGQVMESLNVESGVGELIIHGLGNAQVQQVDLKGGVGSTEIDLTGDLGTTTTSARIKVGVGSVKLTIPREADVEIEAEGSFLSNISAPSFDHSGHTYTHRGDGGSKIRIQVESGVGGVEVELI